MMMPRLWWLLGCSKLKQGSAGPRNTRPLKLHWSILRILRNVRASFRETRVKLNKLSALIFEVAGLVVTFVFAYL